MVIEFSGNAGQIREAFHTEIHNLDVKGQAHIANMSDPRIPVALAGVVNGVTSLHDFKPHSTLKKHADFSFECPGCQLYLDSGPIDAVVPADLATIYNLNPAFAAGFTGAGQTIAVIEDTLLENPGDVATFRSAFGLSGYGGTFTQQVPTGAVTCNSPGVNADETEAAIDAEWAGAAAPDATIVLAACSNQTTVFGGLYAILNLINGSSPPQIMSVSYSECEAENGAAANQSFVTAYQQAQSEGISVFVASGDSGAAGCDYHESYATHGIAVNGFGSTPYNVAVGGTDFADTFLGENTAYWNSSNNSNFGSALSYIPEMPWNDSCASQLIYLSLGFASPVGTGGACNSATGEAHYLTTAAGSGGPSSFSAKPAWQSVFGNFSDGARDLPDVSLFAGSGIWGHFLEYCMTDTSQNGQTCDYSNAADAYALGAGGTSFSSSIMAGIQALINQTAGTPQGNPVQKYYQLASSEYGSSGNAACNSTLGSSASGSCIFYDVTLGDIDVDCRSGSQGAVNCFNDGGANGALSQSNVVLEPAYPTTVAWDFATGLGSVNGFNLVKGWGAIEYSTHYIRTVPAGLQVSIDGGTPQASPVVVNWQINSQHTIATTSPQTPSAGTQDTFASWSDGGPLSHPVTASTATPTYTATFNTSYLLTTAASPASGGSVSPVTGTYYASGTVVPLTATPAQNYVFSSWTGNVANAGSATTSVTMSSPQSVTANFVAAGPQVTASPSSIAFGNVEECPIQKTAKQTITLIDNGTSQVQIGPITLNNVVPPTNDISVKLYCDGTLGPKKGHSCTIGVSFKPSVQGTEGAMLNIPTNAPGSPVQVEITGAGIAGPKCKSQ